MAKLSGLKRTKTVVFSWEDSEESLTLKVRPDDMTGSELTRLREEVDSVPESNESLQHRFLCDFLASIIVEWDLVDEDDKPIPITGDSLYDSLPVSLVGALLVSIQEAMMVDPTKGES